MSLLRRVNARTTLRLVRPTTAVDVRRALHPEVTPLPEDSAPRSLAREAVVGVVGLTVVGVLLGLAITLFEALR